MFARAEKRMVFNGSKIECFFARAQNHMAFERVNQHPTVLKARKLVWLCNGPKILWF